MIVCTYLQLHLMLFLRNSKKEILTETEKILRFRFRKLKYFSISISQISFHENTVSSFNLNTDFSFSVLF